MVELKVSGHFLRKQMGFLYAVTILLEEIGRKILYCY